MGGGGWKREGGRHGPVFSNQDGPEPALLGTDLSWEEPEPCLDQSELLSIEHFHCTEEWGWLVKT